MRPILFAMASCRPIGAPHCTRSPAHWRQIVSAAFAMPAQPAGIVNRPVLSVTSASFRPLPSPQRMFSFGTLTFVNWIRPFSIAFNPMNRSRCFTRMPGHAASTMKAVICFWVLPFGRVRSGVRAITTKRSARVPLVHHSFSPLIR